ncbi:beta-L-arabinofuranosidase domain-containing protein [Microbacterium sp. SS28]|uniref:beta-L-arabinofuranosidase domain-containing protein n=1 Tax=Microbacterium sp. SS28 TaxID=2919948 RepID=UPI001FAA9B1B|nr:beta-L-arabinofuranosidase domain-containing protein [Microbacterium sp. SS28]
MQFLPLSRVRITDGPFANAVRVDLAYALALDPDRLLAPFLREAGLPAKADGYGNWEDSGLDGHIAGHELSALAHLWSATDSHEARERLVYLVAELARAQEARGTGYVGGIPGGRALFEAFRDDAPTAARQLGGSDHWVPWYNLHKTFQGLIDAHAVGGVEGALEVVVRLADWWLEIARTIDDASFEAMLDTEFGGMNEAFALLAELTGRAEYAAMAERFSHRVILDPLLEDRDDLTGRHANTQIPKAVGYAATATATGDDSYRRAADAFWRTVVERRTVAMGGNSVREHFHGLDDFSPMTSDREGPETCNTYNMLKLTRALAEHELEPAHLAFAERALFNHLLASQHPSRGGFVYFTSMRPRHYRVYSQVEDGFWCCVGTGLEAQARYAEWVFGVEDGALAVNLFVPAEAEVPEFGGRIRVETRFPEDDAVAVVLELEAPREFALRLRVPDWAGALDGLAVNGVPAAGRAVDGALVLQREWLPGDTVTFRAPLRLTAEPLPDGSPWQAFRAGPIVLAARAGTRHLDGLIADDSRMGHIAHGPLFGLADLPIVAPGVAGLEPQAPLRYALRTLDADETIELEPFAGIHDERYTVYWPVAEGDVAARRAALLAADASLSLDEATIDAVAFGEQQPESDHGFRATASEVLTGDGRRRRVTRDRMSVRLRAAGARVLRVGLLTGSEPTRLIVRVDGTVVADEHFDGSDESLELEYELGGVPALAQHPESVVLELSATDGRATPGVTVVRVLR